MTTPLALPLLAMVLVPILAGLGAYFLLNKPFKMLVFVMQLALLAITVGYFEVLKGTPVIIELLSKLPLPLGMSLRLDRLSAVMLLLSNFLFWVLLLFNFNKHYMDKRFYLLFLALQGLINGIFLSNDLFNIYLFIELATIVVSVLIMYKKDAVAMYDGMLYLMVNMVAMALFLFGIAFIYKHFGRFDLSGIEDAMYQVTLVKPLFLPMSLMVTAACLKAAVLPLYSWLPKAHSTASAPSVVSAILSGIFVKTGVYLLLRMTALFEPAIDMGQIMQVLAAATALFGLIFAVAQTDIKGILAYHTISQVGLMLMGFYSGTDLGYQAGLYHLLNHGVFKSLLFIVAGLLVEQYRSRELKDYGGLMQLSPGVGIALLSGMLSIMGAPLFSGGASKYWLSKALTSPYSWVFMLVSLGTVLSFIKLGSYAFGSTRPKTASRHPLTWNQKLALGVMVLVSLLLGSVGAPLQGYILGMSASPLVWWQGVFAAWPMWSKGLEFILYVGLGYGIYHYSISKARWVGLVKRIDLTYNGIMLAIVVFLAVSFTTIYWVSGAPLY